jgi:hypothetical protein
MGLARENHKHDVVKAPERQRGDEQQKRRDLVAKAARMEALDTATDEILKAAKNLEKEVRKETKYWQEIVSISDKGWPIHRTRADRLPAPFAVRYGFPEGTRLAMQIYKQLLTYLQPALTSRPVAPRPCEWTTTAALSSTRTLL